MSSFGLVLMVDFETRFMFDHVAAEIAVARSVQVQERRCDESQSAANAATRSTWTRPCACRLCVLLDPHVQTGSGDALTEAFTAISVTPFLATRVKNKKSAPQSCWERVVLMYAQTPRHSRALSACIVS